MTEIIKGKIIELGKLIEYGPMPRRMRIVRVENENGVFDAMAWGSIAVYMEIGRYVIMVKNKLPYSDKMVSYTIIEYTGEI